MAHPSLFPGSGLELQDPALVGASSFVDGEFCRCSSKGDVIVINPANGRVVRRALAIAPSDLDRAVTSADRAFHKHWRDTAPTDRAQLLSDWAKLIREARDDIANIITLENGMSLIGCCFSFCLCDENKYVHHFRSELFSLRGVQLDSYTYSNFVLLQILFRTFFTIL